MASAAPGTSTEASSEVSDGRHADELGSGISLATLKGDQWKDCLEKAIRGRVADATAGRDIPGAEEAVEDLVQELSEMQEQLQAAVEQTELLQRDAILLADEHFILAAERGDAASKEELQVALRAHVRKTFCRNHNGQPWSVFGTTPEQLRIYGTGIHLYFKLTDFFLKLVCLAACLYVPLILMHMSGNGLRNYGGETNQAALTTAGNVGTNFTQGSQTAVLKGSWTAPDLTRICGSLDAVVVLVIYLSAFYFELGIIRRAVRVEANNSATPTAYSLYVDFLPERMDGGSNYSERLTAHFESLLRAEVTPANAVPGLRVLSTSKCEDAVAAARSFTAHGQRKGVVLDSDGAACRVRWRGMPHGQEESECLDLARPDGSASLMDAALFKRMEQSGCAKYAVRCGPEAGAKEAGGSVHQVVLVRDFGGKFGQVDRRPEEKSLEELPVLGAFVVLRHAVHRDFLHDIEYRFSRSKLGRVLQPHRLRFEGSAIRISEAPAPTDVFWENMDTPARQRRLRRGLIMLACLVMVLVCAVILALAKVAAQDSADPSDCSGLGTNVTAAVEKGTSGDCHCSQAGLYKVLEDDPPGINGQCGEWLKQVALAKSLSVGGAVVSTVVNLAIGYFIEFLANWAKPLSVTSRELNIMQMTFVFKLLTLGVLLILVNADFRFTFLGMPGILGLLGGGKHADISPGWFADVGWQVILVNIFGILNPVLFGLQAPIYQMYCWWKMRKLSTWEEFKTLHTPLEFPFALQHAEVLSAMFVTLLLSSGMPLLAYILLARLALYVLADRLVLLRSSRVPPRYTHHLSLATSKYLQLAVWCHSALAIWIYGNPEVYPSDRWMDGYQDFSVEEGEDMFSRFCWRAFQSAAFPNTCVLTIITCTAAVRVLVFIFGQGAIKAFAGAALEKAWKVCIRVATVVKKRKKRAQLSMREDSAFDRRPMKEMQRRHIAHSYDPFDLPQYRAKLAGKGAEEAAGVEDILLHLGGGEAHALGAATNLHGDSIDADNVAHGCMGCCRPGRSAGRSDQAHSKGYVASSTE